MLAESNGMHHSDYYAVNCFSSGLLSLSTVINN